MSRRASSHVLSAFLFIHSRRPSLVFVFAKGFHQCAVTALDAKGPCGLTLWETIAVAGDIRCADLLLSTFRSVLESEHSRLFPHLDQTMDLQPSIPDTAPSTERMTIDIHLAGAVHLCCALGNWEMFNYLLCKLTPDGHASSLFSCQTFHTPTSVQPPFSIGSLEPIS